MFINDPARLHGADIAYLYTGIILVIRVTWTEPMYIVYFYDNGIDTRDINVDMVLGKEFGAYTETLTREALELAAQRRFMFEPHPPTFYERLLQEINVITTIPDHYDYFSAHGICWRDVYEDTDFSRTFNELVLARAAQIRWKQ